MTFSDPNSILRSCDYLKLNVSETAKDAAIVAIEGEWETAYTHAIE